MCQSLVHCVLFHALSLLSWVRFNFCLVIFFNYFTATEPMHSSPAFFI